VFSPIAAKTLENSEMSDGNLPEDSPNIAPEKAVSQSNLGLNEPAQPAKDRQAAGPQSMNSVGGYLTLLSQSIARRGFECSCGLNIQERR
jgi:hypothetical protein